MTYAITVDTGGTFTDLVLANEQRLLGLYKSATVPADPFQGVASSLELAARSEGIGVGDLLGDTATFVYATTFATNAILTGRTAKTAFLTTSGHPDILLFREGGKSDPFDPSIETPRPYVSRSLTFEVDERILSDGSVDVPLDEGELVKIIARLRELEVEAVGVSLLWSTVNPEHELRIAGLLDELAPDISYSLGHRVNPVLREYRRASATVLDASIKPLLEAHLHDFDNRLRGLGFTGEPLMVTHVTGGVLHFDEMSERPLNVVDSGPVMAPVAAQTYIGSEFPDAALDAIIVDTGGTSFDVSLLREGEIVYTAEKWLGPRYEGHMTGMPAVDCRSIGAGGGSIASVDSAGLLHVGPASAGSDPGPACYGRGGTKATVTDAAVVLGYLDPEFFLGGTMALDVEAARAAVQRDVAEPLGLSLERAAYGIVVVAAEEMQKFVREMTVGQGLDPRECVMVAGGGASGLLAPFVAQAMDIRRLLIPSTAAALSATGCQYADLIADFSRAHVTTTAAFDYDRVNATLSEIDEEVGEFLEGLDGFFKSDQQREYACGARYLHQIWELDVPLAAPALVGAGDVEQLAEGFHEVHERLFAVREPGQTVELLTWHGRARARRATKPGTDRPTHSAIAQSDERAVERRRPVAIEGEQAVDVPVYYGPGLSPGAELIGPGIVEEPTTTIVLPAGASARVTPTGNYLVELFRETPSGEERSR